jgi:GTP-binding nuclear protein Ran
MTSEIESLEHAFLAIREIFVNNRINATQRSRLKDLAVQRNGALLGAVEAFRLNNDTDDFLDTISVLLGESVRAAAAAAVALPSVAAVAPPTFKIVLVGDGGVGKTAFVKKLLTGEFERKYVATLGVEVHVVRVKTTLGDLVFKLWDTAGLEKFGGLRDGYYLQASASIVMFDMTARVSYKNVPNWHRDVCRVCDSIPFVLVGNKALSPDCRIKARQVTFHRKKNLQFFNMDLQAPDPDNHIWLPLLYIARKITNQRDLQFLEADGSQMNIQPLNMNAEPKEEEHDGDDDDEQEQEQQAFCEMDMPSNPLYSAAPMAAPSAFFD